MIIIKKKLTCLYAELSPSFTLFVGATYQRSAVHDVTEALVQAGDESYVVVQNYMKWFKQEAAIRGLNMLLK